MPSDNEQTSDAPLCLLCQLAPVVDLNALPDVEDLDIEDLDIEDLDIEQHHKALRALYCAACVDWIEHLEAEAERIIRAQACDAGYTLTPRDTEHMLELALLTISLNEANERGRREIAKLKAENEQLQRQLAWNRAHRKTKLLPSTIFVLEQRARGADRATTRQAWESRYREDLQRQAEGKGHEVPTFTKKKLDAAFRSAWTRHGEKLV